MFKSTNKLESVKSAFKQWRLTRPKQGKIPGYLWEQVNELLADYSLTKICSTLSITYNQIKDNIPSFERSSMPLLRSPIAIPFQPTLRANNLYWIVAQ